ncbi:hypothetical protein [Paracoccus sp. PAR01]|uniref:hypothetical protein n=1 Tax=Paracoccus sp. PAR01 TaxID=2769282 RepID=UPI00177C1435|nr:hypothetical protein [Paracoccus sp. PAR01]MBD9528986.1 hypothetical protein [Paracoccus sp. PAR01]
MTDNNQPIAKDAATGRFLAGNSGNGGRKKGSRSKLGEQFVQALQEDFEANGVAAIEVVRVERPQDYLKIIASLMPKDVNLNINPMEDATDDELIQRLRDLESVIRPFIGPEGSSGDCGGTSAPKTH